MITIYANWTGNSLATGRTLDEARGQLNAWHCGKYTVFGYGPVDLTALDTGPHVVMGPSHGFGLLSLARDFFPEVPAFGAGRLPE